MIDTVRSLSFGQMADVYDRYRPEVPSQAVDWLLPDGADTVIDLGAGTGALTRTLMMIDGITSIIGVEPDRRMRECFSRRCPGVQVLPGTAETMPLSDSSADAVIIAMAWHWVEADQAIPEIARVLRFDGVFGVLWNHRDLSVPWVKELDQFTRAARARVSGQDRSVQAARSDVPDPQAGDLFSSFQEIHVPWRMTLTARELVGHLGTDASAITLAPDARRIVDEQVAIYLDNELGLNEKQSIELPMDCRCLRATRLPNPSLK